MRAQERGLILHILVTDPGLLAATVSPTAPTSPACLTSLCWGDKAEGTRRAQAPFLAPRGVRHCDPPRVLVLACFPKCAFLFDLQVEISCPGSEMNGAALDKGSQSAFQALRCVQGLFILCLKGRRCHFH